jgi:alpha-glucosidase
MDQGGNVGKEQRAFGLLEGIRVIGLRTAWEAYLFARKKRRQDARFATPVLQPGPWQQLGALRELGRDEHGVVFHTDSGSLRLDILAEDCYRVRVAPDGQFPEPFSYAVDKTAWEPVPFSVEERPAAIVVQAGDVRCRVERDPLKLVFATQTGRIVCEEAAGSFWRGREVRLSLRLAPHESGHGLGERAFGLNLRGRTYRLWNADPAGYSRGIDPINLNIPFYVGLRGLHAYGVFWDNSARGAVSVGAPGAEGELIFTAEAGGLCYYVLTGPTAFQVLERYTELTGRMPLPPLWALGYHQCRWSYMSADIVRAIAGEFRRRRIPCDAIYLDIDYMDGFRCFTWDPRRFPDPSRLTADLAKDGFKTVVILDPGIKADHRYSVCRSGLQEGVFLKYPDGEPFVAPVWPGNCYFPDFTSPAARAWWGRQYAGLLDVGVNGFWNDMGEPAIFGSVDSSPDVPDYVRHDWEGQGAPHLEAHNVYGLLMGRASREGLERLRPDRRHLLIVRAGFAGVQRYASSWTADNLSEWDHLRLSISMCFNLGLSGLSFTGPDIGGFGHNADGELFVRWVQLGALLPFFRGHTAKGTAPHEPWAFGQPYEDIARRYIELRYRLLPYLYTVFALCAAHGWPIVRPPALADPSFADCDDEYLLGDALLVAPVVEREAAARTVRLPSGDWYDYWAGRRYGGDASYEIAAPLDALPLYEDAGEGKAYQNGAFRWSRFVCGGTADALVVEWHRTGDYRPAYDRARLEVVGLVGAPEQVEVDGQPVADWAFAEGVLRLVTGVFDTVSVKR